MATQGQQTELNLGKFSGVDASGSAESFLAELDRRDRLPQAVAFRKRLYELLQASPGDRVADVGCGTGKVVAELMECGVNAIGIDLSEQALLRARSRFPTGDFRLASASALPFETGELTGYMALLLYQHIQDPAPSLAEARRVLASGGRLVLADVENDLWAVDSDEQSIVRRMLPAMADSITNPWIGRRSRALLLEAGFVEVTVELQSIVFTNFADAAPAMRSMAGAAVSAGAVTREQADSWLTEQERRDGQGRLFAAIPMFMASARQP